MGQTKYLGKRKKRKRGKERGWREEEGGERGWRDRKICAGLRGALSLA